MVSCCCGGANLPFARGQGGKNRLPCFPREPSVPCRASDRRRRGSVCQPAAGRQTSRAGLSFTYRHTSGEVDTAREMPQRRRVFLRLSATLMLASALYVYTGATRPGVPLPLRLVVVDFWRLLTG
jgi:hypothetical protein